MKALAIMFALAAFAAEAAERRYVTDEEAARWAGVGLLFWAGNGSCSAVLIRPDVALTVIQYQEEGESSVNATIVYPDAYKTGEPVFVQLVDPKANADPLVREQVDVELTTEELPKSPVGKLARKVLREPHWEGHDRRVAGN